MAFVNKALDIKFKGKRFDCDSVEGHVKETNYFAEREGLVIISKFLIYKINDL